MGENDITIKTNFPWPDMVLWQKLMTELRFENRFSVSEDVDKFVRNLIFFAGSYKVTEFKQGETFYRARINEEKTPGKFELKDMGAPPKGRAGHGRLNPIGIPYLYAASQKDVAVCEVRPWVGCKLTVAEIALKKNIRVINFSKKYFLNIVDHGDNDSLKGAEVTWSNFITWMFSAPFDPKDDLAYIPTQYLAEKIKASGVDGIIYDSALCDVGFNLLLFKEDTVKPIGSTHAIVKAMSATVQYE